MGESVRLVDFKQDLRARGTSIPRMPVCSCSTVLMRGVANSPFGGFVPTQSFFEPAVALVCILIAGAIGLLSSLVPALGAARAPIVEALRSTD